MPPSNAPEADSEGNPTEQYATLYEHEIWWRDRQQWLEERGYMLRPRYRPNWKPSWEGKDVSPYRFEDAISTLYHNLMDATRISDGKVVMLKKINDATHPYELQINRLFSTEPIASHPSNHCARAYEILDVPGETALHILVMPFLRPFNRPAFETVGEMVDCLQQVFEGLQFMHQCHIAHRDCMDLNIMMDPTPLYPNLYHPRKILLSMDLKSSAKHYTRTRRPTKYYFIDFGLSGIYDPAKGPAVDYPVLSGDKTVPEYRSNSRNPHQVYPTDVYYIGNMVRESFLQTYQNVDFLRPLVGDMVQDDPSKRPSMDEVVRRFAEIQRSLSWWKLHSRLVPQGETGTDKIYRSTKHAFRTIGYIATLRSAVPSVAK
ncbi:hypothetical protein NM688_g8170 [Phlebia brevispora]|uniref:Uncharacterized protein n=1 Tax=Phlebia brevispora TaxID=194682 RepID=A0ACC1RWG3_9APHY|nr:hypothetical protein NM688_g8170 [Phlebia brevispora]